MTPDDAATGQTTPPDASQPDSPQPLPPQGAPAPAFNAPENSGQALPAASTPAAPATTPLTPAQKRERAACLAENTDPASPLYHVYLADYFGASPNIIRFAADRFGNRFLWDRYQDALQKEQLGQTMSAFQSNLIGKTAQEGQMNEVRQRQQSAQKTTIPNDNQIAPVELPVQPHGAPAATNKFDPEDARKYLEEHKNYEDGIALAKEYLHEANSDSESAWQKALQQRVNRNWEALTPEGKKLRYAENYLQAYKLVAQGKDHWYGPDIAFLANEAAMIPGWQAIRAIQNIAGQELHSPASLDALSAGYEGNHDAISDVINKATGKSSVQTPSGNLLIKKPSK